MPLRDWIRGEPVPVTVVAAQVVGRAHCPRAPCAGVEWEWSQNTNTDGVANPRDYAQPQPP